MLFAVWEVRIVKNCDRGLENAEKQNNICINVFGFEGKQPYPIRISKVKNADVLNLLLITKDEKQYYAG